MTSVRCIFSGVLLAIAGTQGHACPVAQPFAIENHLEHSALVKGTIIGFSEVRFRDETWIKITSRDTDVLANASDSIHNHIRAAPWSKPLQVTGINRRDILGAENVFVFYVQKLDLEEANLTIGMPVVAGLWYDNRHGSIAPASSETVGPWRVSFNMCHGRTFFHANSVMGRALQMLTDGAGDVKQEIEMLDAILPGRHHAPLISRTQAN